MNDLVEQDISEKELEQILTKFTYSKEFLKHLETNKNNFGNVENSYLSQKEAAFRIKLHKYFETSRDREYDPLKDIYGFTFSLKSFLAFTDSIKGYNDRANLPEADQITGVRVYQSWRYIGKDLTEEVFMIPTVGIDGRNLYLIDDDFKVKLSNFFNEVEINKFFNDSDDLILDASIPCPNNCN